MAVIQGSAYKEAQDYIPHFQNWISQDKDPRLVLKLMRNNVKGLPTMADIAAKWLAKKVPDLKEKTQTLSAATGCTTQLLSQKKNHQFQGKDHIKLRKT